MNPLMYAVLAIVLSSTAALAGCPTLTGFAAFKQCYLEADSAMELNNLRTKYETMLAEDRAKARARDDHHSLEPLGAAGPLARRAAPELQPNRSDGSPLAHRSIEAEMRHRDTLRQQRNFDAGRARNQFRVDQGRARSQDLLFGTSKR